MFSQDKFNFTPLLLPSWHGKGVTNKLLCQAAIHIMMLLLIVVVVVVVLLQT
jgi:hypothetical protein